MKRTVRTLGRTGMYFGDYFFEKLFLFIFFLGFSFAFLLIGLWKLCKGLKYYSDECGKAADEEIEFERQALQEKVQREKRD